jgi:acetylornithine deacetylase/succinyl-diaminopimelate desuccinylase-like protein
MTDALTESINALMTRAKADLAELVAIPSVADPRQYPIENCHRAAAWVADAFRELGFADVELADTVDGSKAVIGHRPGPEGAPTVLLYCHYDVQPPLDDAAWTSPPFELTERDGRWYGRGSADCKGNIAMHLTALRALGPDIPVHLTLVAEGSEEQGTGGLEDYVAKHAEQLRADAILVCDTGNAAVGRPAATVTLRGIANVVVTVSALESAMHSGMFAGPAPDALAALVHILATLRDAEGDTTIEGLDNTQSWSGAPYGAEQFRADATMIEGTRLLGSGSVAEMLWARPAVTILGIDAPPVVGSSAAIRNTAAARLNLRVPPGTDPHRAQDALTAHLKNAAPWGVRVEVEAEATGSPFEATTTGPAYTALAEAMAQAYGTAMTTLGQGGSIPLCNVFADTFPQAEIVLIGVEEPRCLIHAPNESVDPTEIARMAEAEARFLQLYGAR